MKILRNYIVTGALYSGDTGPEAVVGDQVKLYLDVVAHPGFPEFILGIIQHPIVKVNCNTSTSYSIEYDEDDLLGEVNFLLLDDVVDVTVVNQVDILADAVEEITSKFVDNFEALREVTNYQDGDTVHITYHSNPQDGGGGNFYFDADFVGVASDADWLAIGSVDLGSPGITQYDNDGTYIKPNNIIAPSPGRWRRSDAAITPGVMRPEWWGAIAYGTPAAASAPAAHDSTEAFRSAVKSLPIRTFGQGVTPEGGLHIRVGTVFVAAGHYAMSGTVWHTAYSQIIGAGQYNTSWSLLPNSAPSSGDEVWQLKAEQTPTVDVNDHFDIIQKGITFFGNHTSGNEKSSGAYHIGAQGAYQEDIKTIYHGLRGSVAEEWRGRCWFTDCLVGPCATLQTERGARNGTISIEHCNNSTPTYLHTDGFPVPALLIQGCDDCSFESLQFENSVRDCLIHNSNRIKVNGWSTNPLNRGTAANGQKTMGFHITGDSRYIDIVAASQRGEQYDLSEVWMEDAFSQASLLTGAKYQPRPYFTDGRPTTIASVAPSPWLNPITGYSAMSFQSLRTDIPVFISFVNTGTNSAFNITRSGGNITVTAHRVAGVNITTHGEMLRGIASFGDIREYIHASTGSGSLDALFGSNDGDSVGLIQPFPPTSNFLPMQVGETIGWGSGGISRVATVWPHTFEDLVLPPPRTATVGFSIESNDRDNIIYANSAIGIAAYIARFADMQMKVGSSVKIIQLGAGVVTLSLHAEVTCTGDTATTATGDILEIFCRGANSYHGKLH